MIRNISDPIIFSSQRNMLYPSVHFFACPKKRTKERASCVSCPAEGGIPGVYAPHGVLLDAAGALQTRLRLKQCKALFRQPLRCSAACQWDFDCIGKHRVWLRLLGQQIFRRIIVPRGARSARSLQPYLRGLTRLVGWACQGSSGQWCLG